MIAVTGAAGFIGGTLARRLAADKHDLLLVDHPLTPAKAVNLAGPRRFQFLEHDVFLADLEAGRLRPDAVFHLGACSATTETDWDYLRRNNVEYTQRLWNWCGWRKVPFVYASSAATYGDGSKGFDDRTPPADLVPLNLYGKSKNDFDRWALDEVAAGRPAPPRWAGLKFFNVYGHGEAHKGRMASVVYQTYRQIQATGGMRLFRSTDPAYPDGGQLRDFVCVDDCVDHMLWLWRHPHPGGVFNSGTGAARSFYDLAAAVFAALGREPNIGFIDMPADLAKQYQNYTRAETGKLRAVGCDVPATTLEEGVRRYVRRLEEPAPASRAAAFHYPLFSTPIGFPPPPGRDEQGSRCESGAGPLLCSARPVTLRHCESGKAGCGPLPAVSQKTCPTGDVHRGLGPRPRAG